MTELIFIGTNKQLRDKLRQIPDYATYYVTTVDEAYAICDKSGTGKHYIVFYEKQGKKTDKVNLLKFKRKTRYTYVILVSEPMPADVQQAYIEYGIKDRIDPEATTEQLGIKINFINDREDMLFELRQRKTEIKRFEVPRWKRTFDIVFALFAIVVLSPVFIITALAIRIESKGPVIFKSKRVGCNYKVFGFYKFRSMFADAEKRLKDLKSKNQYALGADDEGEADSESHIFSFDDDIEISRDMLVDDEMIISEEEYVRKKNKDIKNAFIKIEHDPRVTKVGRVIRKYSIDELPQLFNILKGDMSVVGNRPLPLYEADKLTSDDDIDRFIAPAGLTGLWQVEKRGDGGSMSAEERKNLDIRYGQVYDFWLDMKILLQTVTAFIQKEDV